MRSIILAALLIGAFSFGSRAAEQVSTPRLYAIDCGGLEIKDMAGFSDTGEYDGKSGTLADGCFLIRHPKGLLLWDTGLGEIPAVRQEEAAKFGVHFRLAKPLLEQLREIGLSDKDVTYLAFSHLHFDHTGNANAFGTSTWLLNRTELDWALSGPNPFVAPETFNAYKTAKTEWIAGDDDVFGDGSVRILRAPGHTPGHQALMLKLRRSGVIILSGDLYHTRENREHARVPGFNTSRSETLASINRIETLIKNTNARLIIQHSPEDFKSLPKFPAYLE